MWKRTVSSLPVEPPVFEPPVKRLARPRLFVSYKSKDRPFALRLAYLADLEGFEYWLDVLDPTLSVTNISTPLSPQQRSMLIASIIEIGLLNSSHLIATITTITASSRWVPYEFGRVKGQTVVAKDASSWLQQAAVASVPEYLYLCPIHPDETRIRVWLASERCDWEQANNSKVSKPTGQWNQPIPRPLP